MRACWIMVGGVVAGCGSSGSATKPAAPDERVAGAGACVSPAETVIDTMPDVIACRVIVPAESPFTKPPPPPPPVTFRADVGGWRFSVSIPFEELMHSDRPPHAGIAIEGSGTGGAISAAGMCLASGGATEIALTAAPDHPGAWEIPTLFHAESNSRRARVLLTKDSPVCP